jgi:acetyl esterase/lipase
MRKWTALLAALFISTLPACVDVSPVDVLNSVIPETGYELKVDVLYGSLPRQKMDIYVPAKPAESSRTIIFVYGGAWREGDKSDYQFVGHALANMGHTVVIPNYRLYPQAVFPDFVVDIVNAIDTLDSSAVSVPNNEIVLMGHSSGAHTVALLASDAQYLESINITAVAVIALAGPYDLPLDNDEVAPVFASAENPRSVNPVQLINKNHPPVLLLHGGDDERVLPFHSSNYAQALTTANVSVALHVLAREDHTSILAGLAAPLDAINQTSELIAEYLVNIKHLD